MADAQRGASGGGEVGGQLALPSGLRRVAEKLEARAIGFPVAAWLRTEAAGIDKAIAWDDDGADALHYYGPQACGRYLGRDQPGWCDCFDFALAVADAALKVVDRG